VVEPHVGHVRSAVNFDVLRRWLTASGYDVTFIRNITDIDDKILIKADEQGRPWYNLAYDMSRELAKAYRWYGKFLKRMGRAEAALEAFELAADLAPSNQDAMGPTPQSGVPSSLTSD